MFLIGTDLVDPLNSNNIKVIHTSDEPCHVFCLTLVFLETYFVIFINYIHLPIFVLIDKIVFKVIYFLHKQPFLYENNLCIYRKMQNCLNIYNIIHI